MLLHLYMHIFYYYIIKNIPLLFLSSENGYFLKCWYCTFIASSFLPYVWRGRIIFMVCNIMHGYNDIATKIQILHCVRNVANRTQLLASLTSNPNREENYCAMDSITLMIIKRIPPMKVSFRIFLAFVLSPSWVCYCWWISKFYFIWLSNNVWW